MPKDIEDPRAIVHASFVTPSPLERYRPFPIRRATDGAISLVSDGDVGPDFNRVLVLGPARPEEVFAAADAFFGNASAYSIGIETGTAQLVEDMVRGCGWRLDEDEPALVLAPVPAPLPPALPGLAIRAVIDAAGFADFQRVSETPPIFLPSFAAALDPAVALFVGYDVAGRPVASSRLTCLGTIMDLMGIVTVPAARRRGYGTALTWAAIAEGWARGCTAATLTATAMGYPGYIRMGFRPVGIYRTYLPPDYGKNDEGRQAKR